MKKIKIAYVIDTIGYHFGGTEHQLILLLKNIDEDRFEPCLCCFKDSSWIQDNPAKLNIYLFNFNSYFSPSSYVHLFRFACFLKRQKFDIVQTQFRDGYIIGILAAKLAGIKTILSTRRNLGYWINRKELFVLFLLNRFVSFFLVNAEVIKKSMITQEKIPPEKIRVIYNGIEEGSFYARQPSEVSLSREELHICSNTKVVVIVANLRPVKGIDVLLKAISLVCKQRDDVKVLIVGEGDEKRDLMVLAHQLGLKDTIKFLGRRNDIPDLLAMSDLGVLSSHTEGMSNSIIEYMMAGLPVVCTDVGASRELIVNSENGIIVPPNDSQQMAWAILKILDSDELRLRMGDLSKKRASELFHLQDCVSSTEEFYLELVGS